MAEVNLRIPITTKIAYGFGAVAFGVKDNGFSVFFLFFYSTVMGVEASLVGLALLLALVFDAVSDPLIGYLSDNTHSRWGRRHPYMYAAAVPVAVSYYFVWSPPASLQGDDLFWYLVLISVFVRTLITIYATLIAEMTDDYDERTSALSYRFFFGFSGGVLITAFATMFLLVPTETLENGMFNQEGYSQMGLVAAVVIFISIIISAVGTHKYIPNLRAPPPQTRMTVKKIYSELWETLATRSFGALFLAALFGSVATGLGAGLSYFIQTFYWGFDNEQISILYLSVVLSALLGFIISPIVSKKMGKKKGCMVVGLLAFTIAPLPVTLRLFDLMPVNGDPLLFPLVMTIVVLDVALIFTYQTLMASMIADLVEDAEILTARRSEGVFFAAISFTRKMVQGLGVVAAGIALTMINFPREVLPEDIPAESIFNLGLIFAPSVFCLWMIMIACISMYDIDRSKHHENLKVLGRG
ncbi:MAG: sugar transporter [Gammaproteobacteria bacterium]|nr:sugar transporter [Gammaproteobacteria bacterium]